MTRQDAAVQVVQECFWGDYVLDATDILGRLESHDHDFARFVFGKISDNARYPSRLIRALFDGPAIRTLLEETAGQPRWGDLRHRLIRANLSGQRELVPERQWNR
jgi:hypothetical protein